MVTFLAELNGMHLWATDIGNAYLKAYTAKKLMIAGGPEFRELEGHILIISKALYQLRTSGLCCHDRFLECLHKMRFTPSKAEPDIWMWCNGDYYEYIVVYVDNLVKASKDPKGITETLTGTDGFKLKVMGPIDYHLGMPFTRNKHGQLCISCQKDVQGKSTIQSQVSSRQQQPS
jgi:hypothetical protein